MDAWMTLVNSVGKKALDGYFRRGATDCLASHAAQALTSAMFFSTTSHVVSHVYLDLPEAPRRMVFMSLWVEEAWV